MLILKLLLIHGEGGEQLIKRFLKKAKKSEIVKEHLEKVSFFRTKSQKKKDKIEKNRYLNKKYQQ
jgi:hypothetical protein